MSESTFDFNVFIKETKDVLTAPKAYFASMKTSGGIAEPLIKALIYGVVAGLLKFIWSIAGLSVAGGLFGGAVGIMLLIWSIVGAIIGLFIGAVILLIISAICKGSTDFEANVRVTAAVMVVLPIGALLGFITGINFTAGLIVGMLVNLFSLYLLYFGLTESLKANLKTTQIVLIVLAVLLVLFTLLGLRTKSKLEKAMDNINNQDFKELMQDMEKDIQKSN